MRRPTAKIFDYHNGLDDLAAGHVRFIGDATARIREDYLRILRLFRFHARYGKGEIDSVALNAAAAEKSGLAKLSGERIAQEFLRLLEAENPLPVLRVMAATGILAEILPGTLDMTRLERLCAIDAANFFEPDPVLRLAAFWAPMKKPRRPSPIASSSRTRIARGSKISSARERRSFPISRSAKCANSSIASTLRASGSHFPALGGRSEESNAIQWRALLELASAWSAPSFRSPVAT